MYILPQSLEDAEALAARIAPQSRLSFAELVNAIWVPLDDCDVVALPSEDASVSNQGRERIDP
jgi:hypothetical protein